MLVKYLETLEKGNLNKFSELFGSAVHTSRATSVWQRICLIHEKSGCEMYNATAVNKPKPKQLWYSLNFIYELLVLQVTLRANA